MTVVESIYQLRTSCQLLGTSETLHHSNRKFHKIQMTVCVKNEQKSINLFTNCEANQQKLVQLLPFCDQVMTVMMIMLMPFLVRHKAAILDNDSSRAICR